MKRSLSLITLFLVLSIPAFAGPLSCKTEVQQAVEKAVDGASVTSIKSRDGVKYTVSYFLDGGDAENEAQATVTVDPHSCAIKDISGI